MKKASKIKAHAIEELIDRQLDRIVRVFGADVQISSPVNDEGARNVLLEATNDLTITKASFVDFSLYEQELFLYALARSLDILSLGSSEDLPTAKLLQKGFKLHRELPELKPFRNNQYDLAFFSKSTDISTAVFNTIRFQPLHALITTDPGKLVVSTDDLVSLRIARGKLRNIANFVLGLGIARERIEQEPVEIFLKKMIHDGLLWHVLFTTFRDIYDDV